MALKEIDESFMTDKASLAELAVINPLDVAFLCRNLASESTKSVDTSPKVNLHPGSPASRETKLI